MLIIYFNFNIYQIGILIGFDFGFRNDKIKDKIFYG